MAALDKRDVKLQTLFNLEPIPENERNLPTRVAKAVVVDEPKEVEIVDPEETDEDRRSKEDYNTARQVHYEALEQSAEALEVLLELAKQSDSARLFEVLSAMIKDRVEMSRSLNDLESRKSTKVVEKNTNNTQNNYFVGSTAELQQMLKDANNHA